MTLAKTPPPPPSPPPSPSSAQACSAPGRRIAVVDLGVALVDGEDEAVPAGQGDGAAEVGEVRDRALRVGRRAEEEQGGALEDIRRDGVEVGEEAGAGARLEVDGVGGVHQRRALVDLIERVRDQHHRRAAPLAPRQRRPGDQVERLAAAGDGEDLPGGVEQPLRQAVASAEPARDRLAKLGRAVDGRVPAPAGGLPADDLGHHRRRRMPRFAHRQDQRGQPRRRLDAVEKPAEAVEGIGGERGEVGVQHRLRAYRRSPPASSHPHPCTTPAWSMGRKENGPEDNAPGPGGSDCSGRGGSKAATARFRRAAPDRARRSPFRDRP